MNFLIAKPRLDSEPQAFLTTLGNSGWCIHMVWNLKGLSCFAGGGGALRSSRSIGQWFKNTLGRWVANASGKSTLRSGFVKHLSIHSKTKFETCLQLDKVNLGPEKPRPKKLQASKQSLNSRALLRLTSLPRSFSSPQRI